MDAVSDRDFVLDYIYACAVCAMHLSRFCEEVILWSTNEFSMVSPQRQLFNRLQYHAAEKKPGHGGANPRQKQAVSTVT